MKMDGSVNMQQSVLVCGAGSIGKRHIANLLQLGAKVSVWRSQAHLLSSVKDEFNVDVNADLNDAINNADAVVVATATDNHMGIAIDVLRAGKALFIEKPLSNNLTGIDQLADAASGKIVEVGCQFRAHQNLIALSKILQQQDSGQILTYRLAMGHRLDAWRKGKDYRNIYSADAARGGGALFDLIHQIDIALWLFGPVENVNAVLSKRSSLDIKGDDVTNLLLTHTNGLTGHIQLDMASPVYRCEAEVMTSTAIFNWSYIDGTLSSDSPESTSVINRVADNFQRNDLFLSHMSHFLQRIQNPSIQPLCSLEDGIAALRVAVGAREADAKGQKISV